MLADEDDIFTQERHDGDRTRVPYHVSLHRPSVRRQEMAPGQLEEYPGRNDPLPEQPESWVIDGHSAQLDQWRLDRPIPAGGTSSLQGCGDETANSG